MTGAKLSDRSFHHAIAIAFLAAIALCTTIALKQLAGHNAAAAVATMLAIPAVLSLIAWPELATLIVVFLLYTNTPAVLVQFHGMPFIVGAALPALLIIPLGVYVVMRRQPLVVDGVLWLALAFSFIQCLATVNAKLPSKAVATLITSVTEGPALYFVLSNVIRTPETLRRVVWTLLAAGAMMGGLCAYQHVTSTQTRNYGGYGQLSNVEYGTTGDVIAKETVDRPRLAGPIGEKNYFAQFLLVLVPLGMFRLWSERSQPMRLAAVTTTVLIGIGIALTLSRGAAVAFVVLLAVMTFMGYLRYHQFAAVIATGVVLVLLLPQYRDRLIALAEVSGSAMDRTAFEDADRAVQGRFTEMVAALFVFADHPILGVGPGMFNLYYAEYAKDVGVYVRPGPRAAHNLVLDVAAETGLLGLICFCALVTVAIRNLSHGRRWCAGSHPDLSTLATSIMFALVAYLAAGVFLSFAYIRYFWFIMALVTSAYYCCRKCAGSNAVTGGTPLTDKRPGTASATKCVA